MPDAPAWLTDSFRDGVVELAALDSMAPHVADEVTRRGAGFDYVSVKVSCWLAQHDPHRRPCTGTLERFHFIGRQRVRNALGALLPSHGYFPTLPDDSITQMMDGFDRGALLLLAEWDARNGGIGCEGHHRRFDNHATPDLVVPLIAVPNCTIEFAYDWGIEAQLEKFPT